MNKARKAVVTGGAGFIGSNLAEELIKRGYHVIVLDNLSTGKRENIEALLVDKNFEFIKGNITQLSLLDRVFKGVDFVFHQAAITSVPRSVNKPQIFHKTNITGTLNVLLAARDNHVKKVIYASSSSVYGETPSLPKREDMLPAPMSPYAVTKLAGEYYCQVFHQVYGLPTISLRYFNVYGPRQDPNSQYAAVIPIFIRRSFNSSPLIIFGDGEQTRDFTFVKDVVEANILAAQSDTCGVFNIGRGERITINSLVKLIMELIGHKLEVFHDEPRPGDIRHSLADISKANAFGYQPVHGIKAGLIETMKSFNVR